MTTEQEKFNELTQSFAAIDKTFKELCAKVSTKSNPAEPTTDDKIQACMEACFGAISNVHQRVSALADDMYGYQNNHQKGHLPPLLGPDQMNKALAALGMDGDYEAQKKHIFAAKDLFVVKGE